MVRTKIIATLGPASSSETVLRKMFVKGLDVVRLNFSHGTLSQHLEMIETVRRLNKKMRRAVKIMQDLEGYRIRVGKLTSPVELKARREYYFTQEEIVGREKIIPFDYKGSLKGLKTGTLIYIDDGRIMLKVKSIEARQLKVRVVSPGILKSNKGINIPGAKLEFSNLTEKDRKDLKTAIKYKLDYVAQSFVSNAADLKLIKSIVKPKHPKCKIFAKIESRDALRNFNEILKEADGILIARGDMGICIPIYKVPVIQKEIIKRCRFKNKPVVVATQMLENMCENSLPTRAEVTDVANAILDGADFLMLSGETAVGRHPSKVIDMMNKIIKNTENYQRNLYG
jgi:pyruvate kinase